MTGGRRHQIEERRGRRSSAVAFGRPTERAEHARRVEDVSFRPLWPLAFDQADKRDVVEVAEPGGLRVEQVDAVLLRFGSERRVLDPVADVRSEVVDGRVPVAVLLVRRREGLEDLDERRTSTPGASVVRVVRVRREERQERTHVPRGRRAVEQRPQVLRCLERGGIRRVVAIERAQLVEFAQVALVEHRRVELREVREGFRFGGIEREMRRRQQRERRVACELRRDEFDRQVECGRHRLGRKRPGIGRLVWDAGVAEDFARQIEVRQRTFEHRPPCDRRRRRRPSPAARRQRALRGDRG